MTTVADIFFHKNSVISVRQFLNEYEQLLKVKG